MRMTGPRSVVEEAFARLNAHDLDGYHALLHDDVVITGTGETRGLEANRVLDATVFAALPDHWRRVDRILEAGHTVAVWLTFGATASATEKPFEVEVCDIVEVRDGRITSITMYGDWAPMYAALQG